MSPFILFKTEYIAPKGLLEENHLFILFYVLFLQRTPEVEPCSIPSSVPVTLRPALGMDSDCFYIRKMLSHWSLPHLGRLLEDSRVWKLFRWTAFKNILICT